MSTYIIIIAFAIIFIMLVGAYLKFFYFEIVKYCNSISQLLADLSQYQEKDYSGEYESIYKLFSNNEYARDAWNEYNKTLVSVNLESNEENDDVFESYNRIEMYSTQPASDYFSVVTLAKGINISFWQNLGGIFTGLGILGTFVGLTFGLSSPELTSNDVETLKLGIKQLLSGVGTAFITSLIGVLLAILFNMFHNTQINKLNSNTNALIVFVEKMYRRKVGEQWLCDVVKNSEHQTNAIKNLSTDIAIKLDNKIKEGMNSSLTTFIDQLTPLFTNINNSLENMSKGGAKAVGETISNEVGNELQGFAKTITDIQASMAQNMQHSQELADATNSKFAALLEDFANKLTESSKNAVEEQNKHITDTIEKMQSVMTEMQETTLMASQKFQQAIDATTDKQKNSLNETCQQIKEVLDQVNTNIKIAVNNMMEASKVANAALEKSITALGTKAQNLSEVFESTANGQANIMNQASDNMKRNLEAVVEKMDIMLTHHDDVMKNTYEQFENGFNSANTIVSKTAVAAADIGKSVVPIKEAATLLNTQISNSTVAANNFNRASTVNTEKILEATTNIESAIKLQKENLDAIKNTWNAYASHFQSLSGEMNKSFEVLIRGTKDYNDAMSVGLENTITQYDRALGDILGRIDSEISALKETTEELVEALHKNSHKQQNKLF